MANISDARLLCNPPASPDLKPVKYQCKCQPGFEIIKDGDKFQCKRCEKGRKSGGVKCEGCEPGHVALPGKHYHIWRKGTLPEGFTANCTGDCSVKVCIKKLNFKK